MPSLQARYFLLTIPAEKWTPPDELPEGIQYLKGQKEQGEGGYLHWQALVVFGKPATIKKVKTYFCLECHVEPSRSAAANQYVWKPETRVENTQFELGALKLKRNCAADWNRVRVDAIEGNMNAIPDDIFIRHYRTLKQIHTDNARPRVRGPQVVNVYWGDSGTGKSRRAFEECGEIYYIKMSSTKWFDGYRGEENVVVDEFTGQVGIEHLLKWFDRYPCAVEIKGGQVFLNTKRWWLTSNIDPNQWYPLILEEQRVALRRRFTNVVHFNKPVLS